MAKKKRAEAKPASRAPNSQKAADQLVEGKHLVEEKDITTFSIRLTDEQRDLLMRAADLKGWTPTNLIRTATLERAAHIINTSRVTKFAFKSIAAEVARRLFEGLDVKHPLSRDDVESINYADDPPVVDVRVPPLPISDVFKLKEAARLGGSEFLNLIVEFAEGLTASQRNDLPEPIDPGKGES